MQRGDHALWTRTCGLATGLEHQRSSSRTFPRTHIEMKPASRQVFMHGHIDQHT
jgi:hypothetical protein